MASRQATSEYARTAGRAVSRVGKAIHAGRLLPQPCVDCGAEKVQAHHHNGYDRAHELDVTWLCGPHHMERHGRPHRPTWEQRGTMAYMERTRPAGYRSMPTHAFSASSRPKRLFTMIEAIWSYLRTDEERAHALALVERLAASDPKAAA